MNPKNIEQYVVKNVVACMDFEKGLKSKIETLEKKLVFYEDALSAMNMYDEVLCLNCSIEDCEALDMTSIRPELVFKCRFVATCCVCERDFCDSHCHYIADQTWYMCESCLDNA